MRARKTRKQPGLASKSRVITVFSSPRERHRGLFRCGSLTLPCALGRSGVTHHKREGDGATPAGRHRLLLLIVRPDRLHRTRTSIPIRPMRKDDGWCDDVDHGRYNSAVHLPFSSSHEKLWRDDGLYDIVGLLDWNLRPRIRRRGSAIFLHLAQQGLAPTAGCIALTRRDLSVVLAAAGTNPCLLVAAKPRRLTKDRGF